MKLFSDPAWKSEAGVLPLSLLHYSPFRWNINATNKAKVRKRRTLLWLRTRGAESWFQEKASAKAALIWCEVSRRTRWTSRVGLVDFLIHVGWNFFLFSAQNQYVFKKKGEQIKKQDFTRAMSHDRSLTNDLTVKVSEVISGHRVIPIIYDNTYKAARTSM